MELKQENKKNNSLIRNILFVLKKNLFLILAVIFITTSLGLGYSYIKKPNYTASVRVNFNIDGKKTTANINEMRLYIDTIVDFCGQGVVVDRANAYYMEWENYQKDNYKQDKTIEDFYNEFATPVEQIIYKPNSEEIDKVIYNKIFNSYQRPSGSNLGTLKDENYISAGAISTKTAKTEDATNWVYAVQYIDENQTDAVEKAFILVLAYKHELYWDSYLGSSQNVEQYFTGLSVKIDSIGLEGINSNVSKIKITLIAFAIGVVLALLVVYIKNLLDNTIKDKDELERITGVEVFGCINHVREKNKDGK